MLESTMQMTRQAYHVDDELIATSCIGLQMLTQALVTSPE